VTGITLKILQHFFKNQAGITFFSHVSHPALNQSNIFYTIKGVVQWFQNYGTCDTCGSRSSSRWYTKNLIWL